MFTFGIFSSHLPYIVLVVTYVVSYLLFSVFNIDIEKYVPFVGENEQRVTSVESFSENTDSYRYHDWFEAKANDDTEALNPFWTSGIKKNKIPLPGNSEIPEKHFSSFLFSRPPPVSA